MTVKADKPAKSSKTTDQAPLTAEKKSAKEKSTTVAKSQATTPKKSAAAKTGSSKKTTTRKSTGASGSNGSKKTAAKAKSKPDTSLILTEIEKNALIEKTAYYIAEARGFTQGDPTQDWLLAESRVNQMILEGNI